MFTRYQIRLVLTVIIGAIVAIVFGIGELWRCGRAVMGPSTVAFSPAGMDGLASHGYVRVTGVRPATDRIAIVTKSRRGGGDGEWKGAYLPLLDGADPSDEPLCVLLAWNESVRDHSDLMAMSTLSGPNGDEIVGFVMSPYDRLDPAEQQKLAPLARVNARNCWVIDVRKPSWLKGFGLTFLGLAVPGGWALWKSRRPVGAGW